MEILNTPETIFSYIISGYCYFARVLVRWYNAEEFSTFFRHCSRQQKPVFLPTYWLSIFLYSVGRLTMS